jgi:hypothetical protein
MLVGVGGLVLGVWGIRSVLVPAGVAYVTTVELMLSLVILIVLYGLLGRLVWEMIQGGAPAPGGDSGGERKP